MSDLSSMYRHVKKLSAINMRLAPRANFGEAQYDPRGTCGPRIQATYQLVVVTSGSAVATVENEEFEIPVGSCALMFPGQTEHVRFATDRPTRHTWVAIYPDVPKFGLADRLQRAPRTAVASSRLLAVIDLGLQTLNVGEMEYWLEALAISAFEAFLADANAPTFVGTWESLEKALHYLEANLSEPQTLGDLAEVAQMSAQHLTRLFRQHFSETPIRYLWRKRTERGVRLLLNTGLSITEISSRVGFQSPYHFSRLVRQSYGASPRELRAATWQAAPRIESLAVKDADSP
ncbi:AraC family transcriptional regulator [Fimbriimonas ginsengisoli]|nr:AraC family transcriptional regulator [Fimbriimonas ginsengisoli]